MVVKLVSTIVYDSAELLDAGGDIHTDSVGSLYNEFVEAGKITEATSAVDIDTLTKINIINFLDQSTLDEYTTRLGTLRLSEGELLLAGHTVVSRYSVDVDGNQTLWE